ncbi:dehydration-responsive element-binding protein 1A-like [Gossypium arboreum]|nr:dehydration-responsive element-binding protein 1A-like [Gossypium arboreum]
MWKPWTIHCSLFLRMGVRVKTARLPGVSHSLKTHTIKFHYRSLFEFQIQLHRFFFLQLKKPNTKVFYFMAAETAETPSSSSEEVYSLATSKPKKRAGRRIFKETRHPIFRGVRQRKKNKWVCELREPNKKTRIWLGTYPTPEMAARAHDVAALAFRGKSACLNFADSVWKLPLPASMDAIDIRRAAVEAAEAFRPKESEEQLGGGGTRQGSVEASSSGVEVNFVDEEAMFDMPNLLASMAEGLLLSPPRSTNPDDDDDSDIDVSLWSY